MGGNALSATTCRLVATHYFRLTDRILADLHSAIPGRRIALIPAYAEKQDFGDADILVEGGDGYNPIHAAAALNAMEVVRNGDVTSIGYAINSKDFCSDSDIFQVDLIKVPAESFEFAFRYFAMNDMGNLLGRIAHKAGFKLGHLGLLYVVRDPENSSHVVAELTVTREWGEALEFLGYAPVRYQAGLDGKFSSLQDIFNYVISSPYCNRDIYLLENRNNKSRTRDRKRKTYQAFLDWLGKMPVDGLSAFDWSDKETVRRQFLENALKQFPEFRTAHQQAMADWSRQKEFCAKFNGKLVAELTGLRYKALGQTIQRFKESFPDKEAMHAWVLSASIEDIEMRLRASPGEWRSPSTSETRTFKI